MTPQLNLFWEGTQLAYHSFARINRALSLSLIASGVVNMTLVPYEPDEFAAENNRDYEMLRSHDLRSKGFQALSQRDLPGAWVRHVFPPRPNRPPKGIKWAAIQPWEYSVMPTIYADALRHADEVWTPSNFSRAALLRSGVENVHVIPWGVDSAFFSPFGETAPLPTTKRFKFLFVGGTIYRKGIDVLLESFCRAFTAADDVCLVIKDAGGSLYKGQTSAQLVQQWQSQPNTPEIVYLDQSLTDAELGALYRACDVFVSPYRGEGFSLPTLEALACGLPVIVTGGGATDDFCDEEISWRIASEPRVIGSTLYGLELPDDATVLEPNGEHLTALMQQAAREPETVFEKGLRGALKIGTNWTWTHTTHQVLTRLDALCGTSLAQIPLQYPALDEDAIRRSLSEKRL